MSTYTDTLITRVPQTCRWRVRWRPPFLFLGTTHIDGFWIAEEQDRKDADGDREWRAFDTWAEAITYADRMARQA